MKSPIPWGASIWILLALLLCVLVASEQRAQSTEPRTGKVSLIPLWIPQAQFAGYMMAREKGLYKAAGMDLEILRGGPDKSPIEYLETGRATFGVEWLPKCIKARAEGSEIVNIGQIIKDSAYLIVCKKTMATLTPKSLNNRKLAHWVGIIDLQPRVFFRKFDISMQIVPNYTSVNLLLTSAVDAISAMRYNEYHLILNSGYDPDDLVVYDLKDYGVNIPEDGLYCSEKTFDKYPGLCKRFVTASLRGWQYAFSNKEETLAVVMREARKAHTGANLAHQRWMLNSMEKLIRSENGEINEKLDKKTYKYVSGVLTELGFIENAPDFREFYRGP